MVAVTTTEAMTAPTTVPKKVVAQTLAPLVDNPVSPANQANPVKGDAAVVVVVARATRSSSPKTARPSER